MSFYVLNLQEVPQFMKKFLRNHRDHDMIKSGSEGFQVKRGLTGIFFLFVISIVKYCVAIISYKLRRIYNSN